jgi:hypothetical protein
MMRATKCEAARYHRPKPYRFVLHHVMPKVCGGQSTPDNTIGLDDSCHYTIHLILWQLKENGGQLDQVKIGTLKQRDIAMKGYQAALAAGTVDRIPDEGA